MREFWDFLWTQGWISLLATLQSPGRESLRFAVALGLDLLFLLMLFWTMIRFGCGIGLSGMIGFLLVLVVAPYIRSLVEDIIPSSGGQGNRDHG